MLWVLLKEVKEQLQASLRQYLHQIVVTDHLVFSFVLESVQLFEFFRWQFAGYCWFFLFFPFFAVYRQKYTLLIDSFDVVVCDLQTNGFLPVYGKQTGCYRHVVIFLEEAPPVYSLDNLFLFYGVDSETRRLQKS